MPNSLHTPISVILSASFKEQRLPGIWKLTDVGSSSKTEASKGDQKGPVAHLAYSLHFQACRGLCCHWVCEASSIEYARPQSVWCDTKIVNNPRPPWDASRVDTRDWWERCNYKNSEWCIWNKSYVNCGHEIKWRMILAVMIAIFTIT